MDKDLHKSIKNASSPDELDKTINITRMPLWITAIAVLLLLLGLVAWGLKGSVDMKLEVPVSADTVYLREGDISKVALDQEVRMDDVVARITEIPPEPVCAQDVLSKYQMHVQGLDDDDWVYCLKINPSAPDGVKTAEIILESRSPMSFFWN